MCLLQIVVETVLLRFLRGHFGTSLVYEVIIADRFGLGLLFRYWT